MPSDFNLPMFILQQLSYLCTIVHYWQTEGSTFCRIKYVYQNNHSAFVKKEIHIILHQNMIILLFSLFLFLFGFGFVCLWGLGFLGCSVFLVFCGRLVGWFGVFYNFLHSFILWMIISHFQTAAKVKFYDKHIQVPAQWAYILLKISGYFINSNYLLLCKSHIFILQN